MVLDTQIRARREGGQGFEDHRRGRIPSEVFTPSSPAIREVFTELTLPCEVIDRATFEQQSRWVRFAGSHDVREWVKRALRLGDQEAVENRLRSKDPAHRYALDIQDPSDAAIRWAKSSQIERSRLVRSITPDSVLYHYDVPILNLAPQLEGVTILLLADIHMKEKSAKPYWEVEALVRYLDERKVCPDLTLIAGDIITKRPEDLSDRAADVLARLPAAIDRFYVPGNHDYYGDGVGEVRGKLSRVGYRDITGARVRVSIDGAILNLFGIDDHLEGYPVPPEITGEDADATNVVLMHNLDGLQRHFPAEIDLVCSGHTHAGEMDLFFIDGSDLMWACRYLDKLNGHIHSWANLTARTLSYISSGHTSHFFRMRTMPAGATLLRLTPLVLTEDTF